MERINAATRSRPLGKTLDLASLGLTSLPKTLPASIEHLDASFNCLTVLPDTLPEGLTELDVSANQLRQLPTRLPTSMVRLDAAANKLSNLPENLPVTLKEVNAMQNQILGLSEQNLTKLGRDCQINLKKNPLSALTHDLINIVMVDSRYRGPKILFSPDLNKRP